MLFAPGGAVRRWQSWHSSSQSSGPSPHPEHRGVLIGMVMSPAPLDAPPSRRRVLGASWRQLVGTVAVQKSDG